MRGEGGWSYLGRSAACPKEGTERSARAVITAQKSAEGIVATEVAKARTMEGVNRAARSCGQSGRITSWNWPLARGARVKPEAEIAKGPKSVWREPKPNARRFSSA